jgi:autotransporter-associated beta strand protein
MKVLNTGFRWGLRSQELAIRSSIFIALSLALSHAPAATADKFALDGHGGVNGLWSTPSNWAGNVAPSSGSPNLEIVLGSNASRSLLISNQDLSLPFVLQRLSIGPIGSGTAHQVNGLPLAFSNLGAAPSIKSGDIFSPNLTINSDIVLNADVTVSPPGFSSVPDYSLNGAISGAGGLRLDAGGNLNLGGTNPNTYAGTTVLDNGQIYLNKPASMLAIPGDLVINTENNPHFRRGTVFILNDNQIAANATVTINQGSLALKGGDQTLANVKFVGLPSSFLGIDGGNVVISPSRTLTIAGSVTRTAVSDPDITASNSAISGGTLDLNGGMRPFHVDTLRPDYYDPTTLRITSAITNGGIRKTGSGTLALAGANTYTGGAIVEEGVLAGYLSSLIGNIDNRAIVQPTGSGTLNAVVSGTGTFQIAQGSNITLGAAQSYTGLTNVTSGGTLVIGASERLNDSSSIQMIGGTFDLGAFNETVGAVTLYGGSITGTGMLRATSYDFVEAPPLWFLGTMMVSASLGGRGQLTVNSSGVLTLSGANTFTGDAVVAKGSLSLTQTGQLLFNLQNAGLSNRIRGAGAVELAGKLMIDPAAVTDGSGIWNLVDVATLNEIFRPSFGVQFVGGPSFTNQGAGLYTSGRWTFTTADGNLTLSPIPEPTGAVLSSFALFAVALVAYHRHACHAEGQT